MTDAEFIKNLIKVKERDMAALGRIYEAYFKKLFGTALSVLGDREEAYDAATEVILKLCDYPGDPARIKNHASLLYTMARNRALDHVRKNAHTAALPEEPMPSLRPFGDSLWLDDIMAVLDEREREIFLRHALWDQTLKQIARSLGMPYITVKRIYAGIKAKVREQYGRR